MKVQKIYEELFTRVKNGVNDSYIRLADYVATCLENAFDEVDLLEFGPILAVLPDISNTTAETLVFTAMGLKKKRVKIIVKGSEIANDVEIILEGAPESKKKTLETALKKVLLLEWTRRRREEDETYGSVLSKRFIRF